MSRALIFFMNSRINDVQRYSTGSLSTIPSPNVIRSM